MLVGNRGSVDDACEIWLRFKPIYKSKEESREKGNRVSPMQYIELRIKIKFKSRIKKINVFDK